jgi:hypothetical protein
LFHISAILGSDQPFLAGCTLVRAFDAQLGTTSGLEGWIDWNLGLMTPVLVDLSSRFCSCFIINASFRNWRCAQPLDRRKDLVE